MNCAKDFISRHFQRFSSGKLIREIDGLRFFAITSVILFHINNYMREKRYEATGIRPDVDRISALVQNGHYGVQLFFAISAFILALPFARAWQTCRARPGIGDYYLRRLTRIEPPYLISLIIYFLLLISISSRSLSALFPHFAASFVYLHNLIYHTQSEINIVNWSLEVEIQFYFLAPLLCTIFAVKSTILRRLIILICMFSFCLIKQSEFIKLTIVGQAQYFLAGFFVVDVYIWNWNEAPLRSHKYDMLTLCVLPIFLFHEDIQHIMRFDVLPATLVAFFIGAFRGLLTNRLLQNLYLSIIGGMCYTIYLYHELIIYALGRVTMKLYSDKLSFELNYLLHAVFFCIAILAISGLLFVLFERPFMKRHWYRTLLHSSKCEV